jgi:hypothetical protein
VLDERLRERPVLHLLGLVLFAGLAVVCLHPFASGLALGEERLRHRLAGPDGRSVGVDFSEHLFRTTGELLDLFQKHGEAFRKTVYSMERGVDRRWKRTVTIE